MDCSEFRPFLQTYMDLEVGDREQIEYELHLSQCPSWREEVNYFRALRRTVKRVVPVEKAPVRLRSNILNKLEGKKKESRTWMSLTFATAGAFSFALALFFGSISIQKPNSKASTAKAKEQTYKSSKFDRYALTPPPVKRVWVKAPAKVEQRAVALDSKKEKENKSGVGTIKEDPKQPGYTPEPNPSQQSSPVMGGGDGDCSSQSAPWCQSAFLKNR